MFTISQTWPFTVATFILLLIAIVEGIALSLGGNVSEWLEHYLPDPWDSVHGPFDKALGWLHVGKVPFLVLLVLFLAGFAITGFALNMVMHGLFGLWLTPIITVPLAFFAALPVVRILGAGLARLIPQDETYAVGFDSLVGRLGTIVNGTARKGLAAQARVRNEHGADLYVMVEPDSEELSLPSGTQVLLVKQIVGNRFFAIANPRPDLL